MISLQKQEMLDAVEPVINAVDKVPTILECSDHLLFTGTAVSAYNGTIAITSPCDTQGLSFSVKGHDFYNFLSKASTVAVSVEVKDGALKFKSGRTQASLKTAVMDKNYSRLIFDGDIPPFKPIPDGFIAGVGMCTLAKNAAQELRGIAVGDDGTGRSYVIETDSNRICVYSLESSMDKFWIDGAALKTAFKVGTPTGYCIHNSWIIFEYDGGTRVAAKRKDHSSYPYADIFKCITEATEALPLASGKLPSTLLEAVSRLSILASRENSAVASDLIELTFSQECLTLFASKDSGEATETIPWEEPIRGEANSCKVWVDPAFLNEAASKSFDFKLCIHGSTPSLYVTSGAFVMLVITYTA